MEGRTMNMVTEDKEEEEQQATHAQTEKKLQVAEPDKTSITCR